MFVFVKQQMKSGRTFCIKQLLPDEGHGIALVR